MAAKLGAVRPTAAQLIDQVHAGKITAAQYVTMHRQAVQKYLVKDVASAATVEKLVGQFNDDLACRDSGCSRELFDSEYAVGACQVNLEFRGYIDLRRQFNPDLFKRFVSYVDGPANCSLK